MTSTRFDGIGELVTCDPDRTERPGAAGAAGATGATEATGAARAAGADDPAAGRLGVLHDAALVVDDGRVLWVGLGTDPEGRGADEHVDVGGRSVVPAFVDSHTHLVFAGDRSTEFAERMAGRRYRAGGIRTTVAATREASDAELRSALARRLAEARRQGTGTVEVKSGYGLSIAAEQRALRLAAEVTDEVTFLGAHVVPPEFDGDVAGYVDLVTGAMLDACAPFARWIDVFVEDGAFDADAARAVLLAGAAQGLGLRVHANQLGPGAGVSLACELGAASADHCTHLDDEDVAALADSGTVATLVPGAEFSTRSPYADGRRLLDAGATVALATDTNPGTSYTTSMPFVIALAVRECGLSPAEAVWAATAGGAAALRRDDVGRIAVGARADLTVLDAPTYVHLAYRPGVPLATPLLT